MELQVLDYPLKILRLSGLDPRDNSWLAKLISFLTATTMFALFVTSVMQIVIEESSLTIVAPVVEAMTAASAGLIRWYTFTVFKEKLCKIIKDAESFWKISTVDPDDQSGASSAVQTIWKAMKVYQFCGFLAGTAAILSPIILGDGKTLPFDIWFPKNQTYGFQIFYVFHAICAYSIVCVFVGTDTLFSAYCGILIAQFKLLNRMLENTEHITTKEDFTLNLKKAVHYHLKLIRFCKDLSIYFQLFLCQYIITVSVLCIELYMAFERLDDKYIVFKSLSYGSIVVTHMALCCFLGQAMSEESSKTASAVYASDWYVRNSKEVALYVQMILIRSAKGLTFSGGGMIEVDLALFVSIMKLSYSVFTLLSSTKS